MKTRNIVSNILFYIGVAEMIVGIILGFLFARPESDYPGTFIPSIFFSWALVGFLIGMLFIGFSEVIKLLDNINNKLNGGINFEHNHKKVGQNGSMLKDEQTTTQWTLSDADMEKIIKEYKGKKVIKDIIQTPYEDYSIVTFEGIDEVDIVNTSGFHAVLLSDNVEPSMYSSIREWFVK
ncbi:hypothetical protein [Bacillus sp. Marseille-P3661]|uniref:hypothetical protein n=1 Tax=Bacillus sp. Marseille-P3661 TaxID=1936234 RepID=UPI000C819CA1|nr:hypothetical protein [Bacillus sp. Marseille-P3661]